MNFISDWLDVGCAIASDGGREMVSQPPRVAPMMNCRKWHTSFVSGVNISKMYANQKPAEDTSLGLSCLEINP